MLVGLLHAWGQFVRVHGGDEVHVLRLYDEWAYPGAQVVRGVHGKDSANPFGESQTEQP